MRAATILLVLVVTAALIPDTDAGWWNKAKETVKKAAKWVRDHCSVGLPPHISCRLNKRRKRAVETGISDETLTALHEACPNMNVGQDASLSEVIRDVIEVVDANGNDELDTEEEVAMFVELVEVLAICEEMEGTR